MSVIFVKDMVWRQGSCGAWWLREGKGSTVRIQYGLHDSIKKPTNNTLGTNTSVFVPLPIGPLTQPKQWHVEFGHARSAAAIVLSRRRGKEIIILFINVVIIPTLILYYCYYYYYMYSSVILVCKTIVAYIYINGSAIQ